MGMMPPPLYQRNSGYEEPIEPKSSPFRPLHAPFVARDDRFRLYSESTVEPIMAIEIIDSHTGGEPTRVVVSGGPNLGKGSLAERREIFQRDHDLFRSAVVNEPRGSDVIVGALLCEPVNPENAAGVIFFNNVDCLWMCGHGTIGLLVTLAHMGRIGPGSHTIETPVGEVEAVLHDDETVSLRNVPSYRYKKSTPLDVPGLGSIQGDVAWGGNWFFLVEDHGLEVKLSNVDELTEKAWAIREALEKEHITGAEEATIDHIELFGPPDSTDSDSKNFVLCPGKAYDRSPCGTGTSAKLACLAEDGKLAPGQVLRQASILGSVFEASYEFKGGQVIPTIKSSAYVSAECTLIRHPRDPFKDGIPHG